MNNLPSVEVSRPPSVLGPFLSFSATSLPVSGRIRAGKKVLSKAAASIPRAKQIFDSGVAAGKSSGAIENEIVREVGGFETSPLVPVNSIEFFVNRRDFTNPDNADEILRLYGAGGVLREFPVVFPINDVKLAMKHGFEAHTASGLENWSEELQDGSMACVMYEPIAPGGKHKRFGTRDTKIVGPCNPKICPMYGNKKCSYVASLRFYVPGIKGHGLIDLRFTSIYAADYARKSLAMAMAVLGRISGTIEGQPIFWISKKEEEVSRIDIKKGKAVRAKHFIIHLEARIDMVRAIVSAERNLPNVAQLTGQDSLHPQLLMDVLDVSDDVSDEDVAPEPSPTNDVAPEPSPTNDVAPEPSPTDVTEPSVNDLRKEVFGIMGKTGKSIPETVEFLTESVGEGWGRNRELLLKAKAVLESMITGRSVITTIGR